MLRALLAPLFLLFSACVSHVGAPAQPTPKGLPSGETGRPAPVEETLRYGEHPRQHARVYRPADNQRRPAVLLIHGGGWTGGEPDDMAALGMQLAQSGFVAVSIGYRLAPEHHHPAQIEDVARALAWMRRQARRLGLKPERIGIWGYSAGAHLAALAGNGAAGSPRPRAVVAGGLPADLTRYPKSPLIRKLMGMAYESQPEAWAAASPLAGVSADTAPTFVYHGSWDWVVGVDNARDMYRALQQAGVPSELYIVRGYGHFATFLWHGGAERAAMDFLARHLAP